jgi:diguanylate cyclase (GGDEF)-like protein
MMAKKPKRISMRIKSLLLFSGLCLTIIIIFAIESSLVDASDIAIVNYWQRHYIPLTAIALFVAGYALWEYRAHRKAEIASKRLEKIATTDMLTGAYNRHFLVDQVTGEIAEARRYGQKIGLLMLDIDHFKHINDQFGHVAGDQVLKDLVTRIQEQLREADTLARWGGEEFLVLLPHCTLDDTLGLAEKLRKLIADSAFPDVGSVQISIGASEYRPRETFIEWLNRTDQALYRAKSEGRNTVRAAD